MYSNNELCDYCNDAARASATGGSGLTFSFTQVGGSDPGVFTSAGVGTYTNGGYGNAYWDDNAGSCRAPGSIDCNRVRPKANQIQYRNGPFLKNAKLIWIFWGEEWHSQVNPSREDVLRNYTFQNTAYFDPLSQHNIGKPTYFMDVIFDDPIYPATNPVNIMYAIKHMLRDITSSTLDLWQI